MPDFQFLFASNFNFFHPLETSAVLKFFIIIIGTLILEDFTTVFVALAAQQNKISILLSIISLWIGITFGDILLYILGMCGTNSLGIRRFLKLSERHRGTVWFSDNLIKIIVVSRFVPGLRLPFYTACGFFFERHSYPSSRSSL